MVMMMAMTASVNASSRPLLTHAASHFWTGQTMHHVLSNSYRRSASAASLQCSTVARPAAQSAVAGRQFEDRLDRRVFVVAGLLLAVLLGLSPRYGFHRDELYFFDCARHLQASYVDQPVFTPLLARLSLALFGVSLTGLRLWPALAGAATTVTGGAIARELGGGWRAQLLSAAATAAMPAVLGADHLMGPTAFDLLAWAVLAWVVLRVERTGDPRWWLSAGAVLGLGLANKHSVGFLAAAVFLGAMLSGGRHLVTNRWFLSGVVLAGLFSVPDLWWQAGHGWATVSMTRQLNAENGGAGDIVGWIVGQLLMATPALVPVWVLGLRGLWRRQLPLSRSLVWAYGILFVFFMLTTGGKIYYLAGAYVYLLAAGMVAAEVGLEGRRLKLGLWAGAAALTTASTALVVLPLVPPSKLGGGGGLYAESAETIGWPQLVSSVSRVWSTIPAGERSQAVVFTSNYGEAGAIDELGRADGLPQAVSGHNSLWWWGPGNPDARIVVAVAAGPQDVTGYGGYLRQFFRHVTSKATLSNPYHVHNQEWGGHVYLCTDPIRPWGRTWSELRHYD
jgi:hypothetical protein